MKKSQVNKILEGKVTTVDCMVEEEKIVNMLGNVVGNMTKQLNDFSGRKKQEREQMEKELGNDPGDTLVKFDKANESVLEGREQVIASLRYVHDFLLLTRTWDNISTRRKIKNFSSIIEKNIFIKDKMPLHMMDAQREIFMKAYNMLQEINETSKEFAEKQNIKV